MAGESPQEDPICRLCLKTSSIMENLFTSELKYNVIVEEFIGLKIKQSTELPSMICGGCIDTVKILLEFKKNCIKSQETLEGQNNLIKLNNKVEYRSENEDDILYQSSDEFNDSDNFVSSDSDNDYYYDSSSDYEPPMKVKATNDDDNKVTSNAILKLNDDCLLHIFSFLPLSEKLKMSRLCKRFENIFGAIMKRKKVLNISNSLELPDKITLFDVRQILFNYGNSIEHILFDNKNLYFGEENCYRFMKYVSKFCPNLKTLKLKDTRRIEASHLLSNLKSLNKLEITDCEIDDYAVFCLSKSRELNSLNLSRNRKLTGKYLNKFENLQVLSLTGCYEVKELYIAQFCKSLKLLRELAIEVYNDELEEIIDLIVDMKNLEKLMLAAPPHTDHMHKIADIQNLKSLTLKIYSFEEYYDLTDLIRKLAEKNTLEALCITDEYISMETLKLIPTIKNIKKIIVELTELDSEFLENCAKCNFLEYLCIQHCTEYEYSDIINLIKKSDSIQKFHFYMNPFDNENGRICKCLISDLVDVMNQEKRSKPFKLILTGVGPEHTNLKELIPSNLSKIFQLSFEEQNYYNFV